MRNIRTATVLIILLLGCASMHAQDSLKRIAAVEELFQVMHMEETMQNAVETLTTVMANSNPALAEYKDIVHDFIAKYMSWARLKTEFVSLYATEFTESEMRDIATFYRSPTGQKAVAKIPVLMQQGAAVGQRVVKEHIAELQEAIQKRMNERKK